MGKNEFLIEVDDLVMWFPVTAGVMRKRVADVKAVDGISFAIRKGETMSWITIGKCPAI